MTTYEELQAEITALKAQTKGLSEKNEKLQKLNDWYMQQLKLNRKKMFGSSSEKGEYAGMDQLMFFNEAEAERTPINPEPTIETITYKRKKKKGSREKLFEQLPVEIIEYTLPEEEQNCPKCGNALHIMSKEIRKELKIVPAKVSVIEHVSYVYACRNCDKNDTQTPVITAVAPKALVAKSFVSPSVMAYIMSQKFVNAMPLYRQEQELKRLGVLLSRQTLSNWMVKGAALLQPLADKMKEELLEKEVLHADETTLEVLCEPDRPAQTNPYMWLYRTSGCDKPIVLYDYQKGRSGRYAKDYLQGFSGYLHTDGWGGYHQLEPEVTLCGCWSHAKRKFNEALEVCTDKSTANPQVIGLAYCQKLFEVEKMAEGKPFNERLKIRLEQSEPIVEDFYRWVEKQRGKTLPQSLLGKALQYAINQKKYLLSFLKDGRIEMSNNRAERSIKPFVIGRKNWLFCNTPGGAKSSAVIYSIVETAKENGLNPYEYLKFVFEQLQTKQSVYISDLLPWSDKTPQSCKLKN